ncbi:hypothetical protein BDW02DRAFT_94673 [Decorospora gaudefroyi]|uniref:Uncharacterized protein n=1 Tax=Decorospora gaudefroyi TaxID=184978 RepID=A0A6A5K0S7_9PLEO|nr:hypothetical protein BDW02DRAFT_94673 [Decorospora gaudefroyi]
MCEIQSISGSSQGCDSHSARKDISRRDPGYYVPCHRRETCCRRGEPAADCQPDYGGITAIASRRLRTLLVNRDRMRVPTIQRITIASLQSSNRSPKSLLVPNLNYYIIRQMTRATSGLTYTAQGGKITKSKTAGVDLWLYIWKLSSHTSIRFLRNAWSSAMLRNGVALVSRKTKVSPDAHPPCTCNDAYDSSSE